jgi:transketolase C-terminal domain/subunit
MRNLFGQLLADSIAKDERIWAFTGDLGFGVLNKAREVGSDPAYNVGAAEQLMLGAAVGFVIIKLPFVIVSDLLLYFDHEWLPNYLKLNLLP